LDEVRHLDGLGDTAERIADPLLAGEGLSHFIPLKDTGTCVPASGLWSCVHPQRRSGRWTLECPWTPGALPRMAGGRRAMPRSVRAKNRVGDESVISRRTADRRFEPPWEAPFAQKNRNGAAG